MPILTLTDWLRPDRPGLRRAAFACSLALWIGIAGVTQAVWMRHAFTPGAKTSAPATWPYASGLRHVPGREALVAFIHPRCPCSRATMSALEELTLHHGSKMAMSIVFITHPEAGLTIDPRTDPLWLRAVALDEVDVYVDPRAVIAKQFGALTSGQVYLFGADDVLAFEGGLTSARGHGGECAGTVAVEDVLRGAAPATRTVPVFGCGLVDPVGEEITPP